MATRALTIMTINAGGIAKTTGADPKLLPKGDGAERNRWSLKGGKV